MKRRVHSSSTLNWTLIIVGFWCEIEVTDMSPTLVPSSFVILLAVANLVEGFGTVVLLTDSANMHSSSYKKQSAGIYWLRISPSVTGIPRGRTSGSSRLSLLASNPPLYRQVVSQMIERLANFLSRTSVRHPQPTEMPNILDVIQIQPFLVLKLQTVNRWNVEVGRMGVTKDQLADTTGREKLRSYKFVPSSPILPSLSKPRVG